MSSVEAIDFGIGFGLPKYVQCSIKGLPPAGPTFLEELVQKQYLSSFEELITLGRLQVRNLKILPILPIQTFEDHVDAAHIGDIASVYILSRCTESLYLKRKAPCYDRDTLSRTVYLFREDILAYKGKH